MAPVSIARSVPPNIGLQWPRSCASADNDSGRGVSRAGDPVAREQPAAQECHHAAATQYRVAQRPHRRSAAADGVQLARRDQAMDVLVRATPPALQCRRAHVAVGQQPIDQHLRAQKLPGVPSLARTQAQHGRPPDSDLRPLRIGCAEIKRMRDAPIIDAMRDLLGRAGEIAAQDLAGSEAMIARNGQRQPKLHSDRLRRRVNTLSGRDRSSNQQHQLPGAPPGRRRRQWIPMRGSRPLRSSNQYLVRFSLG